MSFMDIFSREKLHEIADRHGLYHHDQHWASHRKRLTNRKLQKMLAKQTRKDLSPETALLNKLTNWQRMQWDKAGRPMGLGQLEVFAAMVKS